MLVFIFLIPQIIKQTIKKKHIPIKDIKLHSKFASGLLEHMPIANKEYGQYKPKPAALIPNPITPHKRPIPIGIAKLLISKDSIN